MTTNIMTIIQKYHVYGISSHQLFEQYTGGHDRVPIPSQVIISKTIGDQKMPGNMRVISLALRRYPHTQGLDLRGVSFSMLNQRPAIGDLRFNLEISPHPRPRRARNYMGYT